MDQDRRAKELDRLKRALATFALQLDAFEARLKDGPLKADSKSEIRPRPNTSFANKIVSAMKSLPSADPTDRPKSG